MCVWSGSTLFGLACLALYLELLQYITKTYLYNFGDGLVRQLWKVSCIWRHWGAQLILVNSWARPSILVAGKGRGGMILFLLFLHLHSCSLFFPIPFFHLFFYLFYLFSPFLWETRLHLYSEIFISLEQQSYVWWRVDTGETAYQTEWIRKCVNILI